MNNKNEQKEKERVSYGLRILGVIVFVFLNIFLLSTIGYASSNTVNASLYKNNNVKEIDFIQYVDGNSQIVDYMQTADKGNLPLAKVNYSECYKLMGFKWDNLPVPVNINIDNSNLSSAFVLKALLSSTKTWNNVGKGKFFTKPVQINTTYGGMDGISGIYFVDFLDNSVVAQTSMYYDGTTYQPLEYDMLVNSHINFGDAKKGATIMDLQGTFTHELGHVLGLADVTNPSCKNVTMFLYSWYGDIGKRSLTKGDILGIKDIYSK